jgi:hypothetical protein
VRFLLLTVNGVRAGLWSTGRRLGQVPSTASRSSETKSGKYRYAVASETSAARATAGMVTSVLPVMSSRAAATMAALVRCF